MKDSIVRLPRPPLGHFLIACFAALCMAATGAWAEAYPNKPIRMIVPFPAGTASDFLARTLGQGLSELYKVQVLIDNRPGAGGLVGSAALTSAAADGYTIALVGPPHLIGALLQSKLPYRPVDDVAPVTEVAIMPHVVVVSPTVPARSLADLVSLAKARPGVFNYASGGIGSSSHIAGELFNRAAGIHAVHVPFKLMPDAYAAMVTGDVQYFVFAAPTTVGMLREGKLRALAVTSARRSSILPDVPTLAEAGLPAAGYEAWFGMIVPVGTPQSIIARLRQDIDHLIDSSDVRERFARQGVEPAGDNSPGAFGQRLRTELTRYQKLIADTGIAPQ